MLYITGHREFAWTAEEAAALRRYLKAGGMLLADACCGRLAFDAAFRREIAKALPESKLERLPADHPLYHCPQRHQAGGVHAAGARGFRPTRTPRNWKASRIDNRLAVIYSRFDLGNGWEQFPHPYSYGLSDDSALKIGTNVLVFAVTH